MRVTAAQRFRVVGSVTVATPAWMRTSTGSIDVTAIISEPARIETEKSMFLSLRATMSTKAKTAPMRGNIEGTRSSHS
jgi:hypothetical protein